MNYRTKLLFTLIGLSLAATTILYLLVTHLAEQSLFRQIQETVKSIAVSTAAEMDGDQHDLIRGAAAKDGEAYQKIALQLRSLRDAHRNEDTDIAFIYTFRPSEKDPEKWIYVVDSQEAGKDHSGYGDAFEFNAENKKDLDLDLGKPAMADRAFTSDKYGTFLSADAPVRNSSGEIVARVGVDFNASDIVDAQKKLRSRTVVAFGITIALGIALSFLLSSLANRPLGRITRSLEQIGAGKLDTRINSQRTDEFGIVERAVDEMAESIQEKSALRGSLSRYVSRDVASDVSEDVTEKFAGTDPTLETRQVTALFCDVDGFESLAKGHPPEKVLAALNRFFARTVAAIFENGGTLDRYSGAGLMATFGAIGESEGHEQLALRTALAMQEAFRETSGCEGFSLRIGIHSDEAFVADPVEHPEVPFKATGPAVDGAARVVALSRQLGNGILASGDTVKGAGGGFSSEEVQTLSGEDPHLVIFRVELGL